MMPPDYFLEHCSYKADKYRQEKHFPNIVAKYFDSAYCLAKNGNGGSNDEIKNFVDNDCTPRFSPFFIPKMIADIAAGIILVKEAGGIVNKIDLEQKKNISPLKILLPTQSQICSDATD